MTTTNFTHKRRSCNENQYPTAKTPRTRDPYFLQKMFVLSCSINNYTVQISKATPNIYIAH